MFKSARIKLTLSYILATMTISLSLSFIIIKGVDEFTQRALQMHEKRVENRLKEFRRQQNLPPNYPSSRFQEPITKETAEEIKKNTVSLLAVINLTFLIISGSLGYWFAGKTLKPIEDMTQKQKKFIADAAHEFKTPLAAVKSQIEVALRDKNFNLRKSKSLMQSVVEDVDSLSLLTNSLLEQSKYQDSNFKLKLENLKIAKLIEKTLEKFEPRIKHKKINLISNVDKNLTVKADHKSFLELLTILIDNAVKFCDREGDIDISANKENKYIVIKISNTGEVISQKDLPFIFDRFYKADTSRTKAEEHNGFGLGLSIAKEIVETHHGTITAESNKKTIFTVKIPQ